MNQEVKDISIVAPFYNEEAGVNLFIEKVTAILASSGKTYEIVCVNDGSTDRSLELLINAKKKYQHIRIINLSRNFGKEAALTAGIENTNGEAIIPIDADLQDPPELIIEFIKYWEEGHDVILAKRTDRTSDNIIKRITAFLFYRFHNIISDIQIPENVGDYRLMTRKVINAINAMPENQRFMKGLFAWVGFKTKIISYKRNDRKTGKTRFSIWKLWNLAMDAITSFSTVPLRIWLYIGIVISILSLTYGSFIIVRTLIFGIDVPGYASLLTSILFLGGIQLIGIGILGEYIGRIYLESKRRPPYIIEDEY